MGSAGPTWEGGALSTVKAFPAWGFERQTHSKIYEYANVQFSCVASILSIHSSSIEQQWKCSHPELPKEGSEEPIGLNQSVKYHLCQDVYFQGAQGT